MSNDKEDDDVSMDSDSDSDDENEQELLKTVSTLKLQLKEHPQFYDGYISLIVALKKLGELEQLREVRDAMSVVFPLTPELWLEWLKDEQKICSTPEERAYIVKLFDRSVLDYTSVKLWLEYIMFMLGGGDTDATRSVCNQALVAVGTHVSEGLLVWQAVLLFEQQVLMKIESSESSDDNTKQVKSQKQRIQNLYKRQFRVPLLNTDKASLLEEASVWFENGIENHMKNDLDKTMKKLQTKISFEESLLQIENVAEKLVAYKLYLDHLKGLKENPVDVQSLYERAITDNALDGSLWEEYIQYIMEKFGNSDYLIIPICERSLRNCPWSGNLVELHISALQQCEESLEGNISSKVKDVLDKGLASGTPLVSEATKMWMSYLTYLRRQINWDAEDHTQALKLFRENCYTAIQTLEQCYSAEALLDCTIPRFLAQIEAEFVKDIQAARDIWNDIILQRNNNFNNAYMWLEFINLERSYGSNKHCRKLFRRSLERVWENVDIIAEAFNRFEQETGTFASMSEFKIRLSERMVHVKKREEELAKKEQIQKPKQDGKFLSKKEKFKEKYKSKMDNTNNWESKNSKNDKSPKSENTNQRTSKSSVSSSVSKSDLPSPPGFTSDIVPPPGFTPDVAPPPGFTSDVAPPPGFTLDVAPPPGFISQTSRGNKRSAEHEDESSPKKPKVNPNHGEKVKHDDSDDPRTVFVSNLDFKTTEEQISNVVRKCGEIKSLRLAKDFKGRSKGFGYLTFVNQVSVNQALQLDRSRIDGRPMFISPCNTQQNKGSQFRFSTRLEKDKLFVRGLPKELEENDVKKLFEKHGTIKELRLVTFRNGFSKGTCYITFESEEMAENARQNMDGNEINGRKLSVLISDPSKTSLKVKDIDINDPINKSTSSSMKPKLAFLPRAVRQKPQVKPETPSVNETPPKSNEDFRNMLLKK